MPRYLIKGLLLILFFAWLRPIGAQQLSWRNYTTAQGMPGNIVYDALEDQQGYMWFVTNQGICRFNGYEFIQPVDTSAMRGSEAFLPTEDARGRIWFARLDASLWFIEKDTVRAWKYNALIAPYGRKFKPIEHLCVTKDGTTWLALNGLGFLVVNKNGDHRVISDSTSFGFVFAEVEKKLIYTSRGLRLKGVLPLVANLDVFQWKNERMSPLGKLSISLPFNEKQRGIWALRNGDFLICKQGSFYLIHENRIVWEAPEDILIEKAWETASGEILIASALGKRCGLFHFASLDHLRHGIYTNLLPEHFVTDIWCDRSGGWWATTHHAGVFYCKNPAIAVFDKTSGLPSSDVVCLTNDGDATIFAGLRPADIVAIDGNKGQVQTLPRPPLATREVQAIFFDSQHQRLWCSDLLLFLEGGQWKPVVCTDSLTGRIGETQGKKITLDPSGKMLWTSGSAGFFRVDALKATSELIGRSDQFSLRTFSITPDQEGNIWVTTELGLRLWGKGRYDLPPFDHPALHFQPRDLIMLPDGGMAISLRATGVLLRDKQGKFTHLTQREGLTSNFITKLYSNPEGDVFACSNAGLNWLKPQSDGGWHIETISTKQGLPSNQVNDVMMFANQTWVATDRGLAHFSNLPNPLPMPAPVLEKLLVNNKPASFTPLLRLAHDENNLFIRFFSLHYRSDGNIPYRYRLLGADTTFAYINSREVNFARLSPGVYTFEVQAQNESGSWSDPTRWAFEIRAAWWQTAWFWAFAVAALAVGASFLYYNRLRKVQHETAVRNKIRELEASALRAQMNPHFIFNCLGSIQHFISENDATSAMSYLARFARLVRLALHGSVDGVHSLQEEMEMLENYLALEQLRFRGKFNYEIKAAPELDSHDIFLPPMLVQPFVENALVHGMKNKTEGGQICIAFSIKEKFLIATVTDNGPGFFPKGNHLTETGHKSVGMTLTQHRLEILSRQSGQEAFTILPLLDEGGQTCGTQVVLQIALG